MILKLTVIWLLCLAKGISFHKYAVHFLFHYLTIANNFEFCLECMPVPFKKNILTKWEGMKNHYYFQYSSSCNVFISFSPSPSRPLSVRPSLSLSPSLRSFSSPSLIFLSFSTFVSYLCFLSSSISSCIVSFYILLFLYLSTFPSSLSFSIYFCLFFKLCFLSSSISICHCLFLSLVVSPSVYLTLSLIRSLLIYLRLSFSSSHSIFLLAFTDDAIGLEMAWDLSFLLNHLLA